MSNSDKKYVVILKSLVYIAEVKIVKQNVITMNFIKLIMRYNHIVSKNTQILYGRITIC